MKTTTLLTLTAFLIFSCRSVDKEQIKNEIFHAEKSFEQMAAEKGVAEAFYHFADEMAVIKRENDTLIVGKENIRHYYDNNNSNNATVNWTPDFIDVADDGTLAYTYGNYVWKFKDELGVITENKGVFHTVWKKQVDGSWKYVWD